MTMADAAGEKHPPFYGKPIFPREEQALICKLLAKYKGETANEELKKKIWDELQMESHLGHITIPFKVVLRSDPSGKYPDCVEVILDTKV